MNPENFGLSGETTQAISGGVFAAGAREYLRPTAGWPKRVMGSLLCLGGAAMFGDEVAAIMGVSVQVASACAGLTCIGVAEGILKAADRFDLGKLWGKA